MGFCAVFPPGMMVDRIALTAVPREPEEESLRIGSEMKEDPTGRPGGCGLRFWRQRRAALLAGKLYPLKRT